MSWHAASRCCASSNQTHRWLFSQTNRRLRNALVLPGSANNHRSLLTQFSGKAVRLGSARKAKSAQHHLSALIWTASVCWRSGGVLNTAFGCKKKGRPLELFLGCTRALAQNVKYDSSTDRRQTAKKAAQHNKGESQVSRRRAVWAH